MIIINGVMKHKPDAVVLAKKEVGADIIFTFRSSIYYLAMIM